MKHGASAYRKGRCHCDVCLADHRERKRRESPRKIKGDTDAPTMTYAPRCPSCEGPLSPEAVGGNRFESRAAVSCGSCRKQWLVVLQVTSVRDNYEPRRRAS